MSLFYYLLYLCFIWKADSFKCSDQNPVFQILTQKSLTLTVFYPYQCDPEEFHIFIYHNNEAFSCGNDINGDSIDNRIMNSSTNLNHCSNETLQCYFELEVDNLGYYCGYMTIKGCLSSYFTPTIKLTLFSNNGTAVQNITEKAFQPIGWIVCVALLSLVILISVIYKLIRHKFQSKPIKGSNIKNIQTFDQHQLQYEPLSKIVQIFVLYHYDDNQHFLDVQKFVSHLEQLPNCEIVLDYKCKDEICQIGMTSWVSNMLKTSDRIVIISSKGACTKVKRRNNFKITSNDAIDLETAFLCGWVMILSDLNLVSNYNKLYNIRFQHTDSQFLLPDVVSGRHFQIPCHYQNLVFQLLGSKETAAKSCANINMEWLL